MQLPVRIWLMKSKIYMYLSIFVDMDDSNILTVNVSPDAHRISHTHDDLYLDKYYTTSMIWLVHLQRLAESRMTFLHGKVSVVVENVGLCFEYLVMSMEWLDP